MVLLFLLTFLVSGGCILYAKKQAKQKVQAQFVVSGCVLVVFYIVCFLSALCTILNFIWNWIL